MKKFFVFCLCLMMILCPASSALSDVAIDESHFPDEMFRLYVSYVVDADANGILTDDEIEATTSIAAG